MAWVFRRDVTGPAGDKGGKGVAGTPASTSKYYDSLSFTPGSGGITLRGVKLVDGIAGTEDEGSDGTELRLSTSYISTRGADPVATRGSVTKVADATGGGASTRTENIYIRGTTTPSAPSGGTTTANHVPSGWSSSNPGATATQNVYRASRTVTLNNGVFQSATVWGNVTKVADATGGGAPTATPPAPARGTQNLSDWFFRCQVLNASATLLTYGVLFEWRGASTGSEQASRTTFGINTWWFGEVKASGTYQVRARYTATIDGGTGGPWTAWTSVTIP